MQTTERALEISDDKGRLDVPLIHRFLSEEAYWCLGIPLATLQRAINHSLCFGAYLDGQQVAFARVITDKATFGYLIAGAVTARPWWQPSSPTRSCKGCAVSLLPPPMPTASTPVSVLCRREAPAA